MINEFLMLAVLAGMGVYFIKSTDLPKELKDRSKMLSVNNGEFASSSKFKFDHLSKMSQESSTNERSTKNVKIQEEKNSDEVQNVLSTLLINKEINEISEKITVLEKEVADTNSKSSELQKTIEVYRIKLETLKGLRFA